jgi:catechol 2,3-dioxygenase-like lactoylglutathione lyase family enzyme
MIKGVHAMFYSSKAEELRAFFRDKLGFAFTDVGDGWLIFDVPEAELAAHPSDAVDAKRSGTHHISFWCDDLRRTMEELKARGVEFTSEVVDEGYGLVTHFKAPGGFEVQLYQPQYKTNPRR